MSVERTFRCDGPDCERHVITERERPPLFLTVLEHPGELHFCGWDCVLRWAATKEPETIIPGTLGGPDFPPEADDLDGNGPLGY